MDLLPDRVQADDDHAADEQTVGDVEVGPMIVADHHEDPIPYSGLVVDADLISERYLREMDDEELPVWTFTVNDPRRWKRLVELGVDGIITDDPGGLNEFLQRG